MTPEIAAIVNEINSLKTRTTNLEGAFIGLQKSITDALKTNQDSVLTIQMAMMFILLRNMGIKDNELRDHVKTYMKLARLTFKDMNSLPSDLETPEPESVG